jgi:hypothetical protein
MLPWHIIVGRGSSEPPAPGEIRFGAIARAEGKSQISNNFPAKVFVLSLNVVGRIRFRHWRRQMSLKGLAGFAI